MNYPTKIILLLCASLAMSSPGFAKKKPLNFVFFLVDDMGWADIGANGSTFHETPNVDKLAATGMKFTNGYAACPVCSPTRATVLTGRTHDRTGVFSHGYALRDQEKPLPKAMQKAGYATGHFGKWHLNGLRGPGVPIFANDTHGPGPTGFGTWLSVTNFFDLNPVMSRQGKFEEFKGDSSEIIVDEALKFITKKAKAKEPFFTVIWYGTPHSPWMAEEADQKPFTALTEKARQLIRNHHREES